MVSEWLQKQKIAKQEESQRASDTTHNRTKGCVENMYENYVYVRLSSLPPLSLSIQLVI